MFLDWKTEHSEHDCIPQSSLQIQCKPYQIINGSFHRIRTRNSTICMETQKTPNCQSNLEKEKWSWRNKVPELDYTTKRWSSKQYGTHTKTETKANGAAQKVQRKPSTCGPLLLLLSRFSRVRLYATPETAAHQAPPSLAFSRKNTGVGCHFLLQCMKVKSESEVAQSCPTPSDPMDCSPPGSSVHGIFQARVLE